MIAAGVHVELVRCAERSCRCWCGVVGVDQHDDRTEMRVECRLARRLHIKQAACDETETRKVASVDRRLPRVSRRRSFSNLMTRPVAARPNQCLSCRLTDATASV